MILVSFPRETGVKQPPITGWAAFGGVFWCCVVGLLQACWAKKSPEPVRARGLFCQLQGCSVSGFGGVSHSHLRSSCASASWISNGNSTSSSPNTWSTICWSILVPFLMGSERARSILVSFSKRDSREGAPVGQKKAKPRRAWLFFGVCYLKLTIWFCFVPGMSRRSWTEMVAVTVLPTSDA